jgi:DnaK suppressor protein
MPVSKTAAVAVKKSPAKPVADMPSAKPAVKPAPAPVKPAAIAAPAGKPAPAKTPMRPTVPSGPVVSSVGKPKDWVPTEDEIQRMPDDEYMNPAQLRFFKLRLQTMEREILSNADETVEHLHENVIVPDPADRATIEEEHALELRTRDRERKLLKKVQQSIGRIDAGDYGWCEETGDPIGVARLMARPTATLSLEAQQRRELRQKLYGD